MIQVDFRTKKNGVPILSKDEIEYIAEAVLQDYNPKLLDNPGVLDVEHFSECYASLEMDYQDLTHDRSILGMTVFNNCYIPVYDPENDRAKKIPVDEGTILIDNSLLEDDQLRRGRFTLGHEASHWLLHRQIYVVNKNQISLFDDLEEEKQPVIKCRTTDIECVGKKRLVTDDDWMEWQADYMASALLMPKKAFSKLVEGELKSAGIDDGYYQIGTDFEKDLWADVLGYELADTFEVSVTAAKIRLRNLRLIIDHQERQYSLNLKC
ncbi:ImmA/IrrE family metallo-endopeptidase [Syntrophomonas erecta]|jgi:Zn-dependent peptidase ImmA (M78 family)